MDSKRAPKMVGGDLAPVEARRAEQQLADLLRQRRYVVQPTRRAGDAAPYRSRRDRVIAPYQALCG